MRRMIIFIFLLLAPLRAAAHEFWIEPEAFRLAANAPIRADLVNGQNFSGTVFAYLHKHLRLFTLGLAGAARPVEGRAGDRPALSTPAGAEGLYIAAYQSRGEVVRYDDFAKFESFLTHKGLAAFLPQHTARGLPQKGFAEFYTRFAKSLIAVGSGAGADQRMGFELEIVALQNPYTAGGPLPVQVFYQGAPRPGAYVELFEKRGGAVQVQGFTADGQGRVNLPLQTGARYLINTVVLREPSADLAARRNVAWESLWASLTVGFD